MKIHTVNIFNFDTLKVEVATAVISTQAIYMYRHYTDKYGLISIEPLSKVKVTKASDAWY